VASADESRAFAFLAPGLPVVLAAGAATLAFDARKRLGRLPRTAAVAVALAALMTLAAVWAAFAG
jgi:hypothetical protein